MKAIEYIGISVMVALAILCLGAWVYMRLATQLWHLPMICAMCLALAWVTYKERNKY